MEPLVELLPKTGGFVELGAQLFDLGEGSFAPCCILDRSGEVAPASVRPTVFELEAGAGSALLRFRPVVRTFELPECGVQVFQGG